MNITKRVIMIRALSLLAVLQLAVMIFYSTYILHHLEAVWGSELRFIQNQEHEPLETGPTVYFLKHEPLETGPGPTVYFLLTAALLKSPLRCSQYARSFKILLSETRKINKRHKIVYVEGNGLRKTCLDDFGVEILYTNNSNAEVALNEVGNPNYGINELMDVMDAVKYFQMKDTDLLVKMTGRYYLDPDSHFMSMVNDIDLNETRALVKFGSYARPLNYRVKDCITGLIMVPVSTIPVIWKIQDTNPSKPIEHHWAAAVLELPENQVIPIQGKMGVHITPGKDNSYFLV